MGGLKMDDLISRQAVYDALDNIKIPRNASWYPYYQQALTAVSKLPSAQPEQRWIPCGERLPEKPNMYTVTDSKGNVVRFVFYDTKSSREYWQRCAKAWMPLPEPYREERRTDDGE